jgi:hypothetical protein
MSFAPISDFVRRYPFRLFCLLLAVLGAVGIYLLDSKIEAAHAELDQKSVEGARLAANVSYSSQLTSQLEAVSKATETITSRLVSPANLATNLQYFYRLEKETGVELIDVRQNTSSGKAKGGTGVAFSVSVKGEYPALLGWLRRVENGPHFARFLSASMGATADRKGPLTLAVTLELLGEL